MERRRKPDPKYDPRTRIGRVNLGYGLDYSGDSFEEPDENSPYAGLPGVLVWSNPDWNTLTGERIGSGWGDFVFAVDDYEDPDVLFPLYLRLSDPLDNGRWLRRVATGTLTGTDISCDCFGHPGSECGKHGCDSPSDREGDWHFTGSVGASGWSEDDEHRPCPDCTACEGDGYRDSPGGSWAVYDAEYMPGFTEASDLEDWEPSPDVEVLADYAEQHEMTEMRTDDLPPRKIATMLRSPFLAHWKALQAMYDAPVTVDIRRLVVKVQTECIYRVACLRCYLDEGDTRPSLLDIEQGWGEYDHDSPEVTDPYDVADSGHHCQVCGAPYKGILAEQDGTRWKVRARLK